MMAYHMVLTFGVIVHDLDLVRRTMLGHNFLRFHVGKILFSASGRCGFSYASGRSGIGLACGALEGLPFVS